MTLFCLFTGSHCFIINVLVLKVNKLHFGTSQTKCCFFLPCLCTIGGWLHCTGGCSGSQEAGAYQG